MAQSSDITERVALLALRRISNATSIDQVLTIISTFAPNFSEHEEPDRDKIVRSAVENTYSLLSQSIMPAANSQQHLWSLLSFIRDYAARLDLKLTSKVEDGNYVVIIEHSMGNLWSLFIRDLIVMIFHKLGKIKPKVSFGHDNNTIFVSFPSSLKETSLITE